MINTQEALKKLEGYRTVYNYDTSYMEEMLKESPDAYEIYDAFLPMAYFSKATSTEVIHLVRIVSMMNQDCGACSQLCIDFALEAGLSKEFVKEIVFNEGKALSPDLQLLFDFTKTISTNQTVDPLMYDKMNQIYTREMMMEIALAIASTRVFPAIKKTLNYFESCSMVRFKV